MKNIFFIIIILFFYGCLEGGTHGSIKSYYFPTTKYRLEEGVNDVFAKNPKVLRRDTLKDEYNDDTGYISFHIIKDTFDNEYTMRFYGGKEDWDTAKTSSIFIAYAHNKEGHGGSEGNGGVKWYYFRLRNELITPFEQEFILKIDKELGVKHNE